MTRRVPHPVLIGHAASLSQAEGAGEPDAADALAEARAQLQAAARRGGTRGEAEGARGAGDAGSFARPRSDQRRRRVPSPASPPASPLSRAAARGGAPAGSAAPADDARAHAALLAEAERAVFAVEARARPEQGPKGREFAK